jgi:hypothetical protein
MSFCPQLFSLWSGVSSFHALNLASISVKADVRDLRSPQMAHDGYETSAETEAGRVLQVFLEQLVVIRNPVEGAEPAVYFGNSGGAVDLQ